MAYVEMIAPESDCAAAEDVLRELCRAKMPRYQMPREFVFMLPGSWPVNASHKVNRSALRPPGIIAQMSTSSIDPVQHTAHDAPAAPTAAVIAQQSRRGAFSPTRLYSLGCDGQPQSQHLPARKPPSGSLPLVVQTWDEWSKLTDVVVGHANHAFLPDAGGMNAIYALWDGASASAPMNCGEPLTKVAHGWMYPRKQVNGAVAEMDNFVRVLQSYNINVRRPSIVNWTEESFEVGDFSIRGGFSNKDPRDAFITIGNEVIECPMGMPCRHYEYKSYESIFDRSANGTDPSHRYIYSIAPKPSRKMSMYKERSDAAMGLTESEPCFDAADCLQFGAHIFMQRSVVTNFAGIDWLRMSASARSSLTSMSTKTTTRARVLVPLLRYAMSCACVCVRVHAGAHLKPKGIHVHNIDFNAGGQQMHIDTTIAPIKPGILVQNPEWMPLPAFRDVFQKAGWRTFHPEPSSRPASLYSSAWLSLNWLQIDENTIIIEEQEKETRNFLESLGIKCIPIPYRFNYELFGSLHCSTIDLHREGQKLSYGFQDEYDTDGGAYVHTAKGVAAWKERDVNMFKHFGSPDAGDVVTPSRCAILESDELTMDTLLDMEHVTWAPRAAIASTQSATTNTDPSAPTLSSILSFEEVQARVISHMKEVFPRSNIGPQSAFSLLGGRSRDVIGLSRRLELPPITIYALDTVKAMALAIQDKLSVAQPPVASTEAGLIHRITLDANVAQTKSMYAILITVMQTPTHSFGQILAACERLMQLHPILRMQSSSSGEASLVYSANDTCVADVDSEADFKTHVVPSLVEQPLFRWAAIASSGPRVVFWVHHHIADQESADIIKRDWKRLLDNESLPPRSYALLAEVQKARKLWQPPPSLITSLAPSVDAHHLCIWELETPKQPVDLLACFTYALARATFEVSSATGQSISPHGITLPVCIDHRLLLPYDLTSIVSMLTVAKLCTFSPTALASLKSVRHVLDTSSTLSTCNFISAVNFVVFDDVKTETDLRVLFSRPGNGMQVVEVDAPCASETHQLCNLQFFPALRRCRIELVRLQAAPEWFRRFEANFRVALNSGPDANLPPLQMKRMGHPDLTPSKYSATSHAPKPLGDRQQGAPAAPVPLKAKVERIKMALDLSAELSIPKALNRASQLMGLALTGMNMPQQADMLFEAIGLNEPSTITTGGIGEIIPAPAPPPAMAPAPAAISQAAAVIPSLKALGTYHTTLQPDVPLMQAGVTSITAVRLAQGLRALSGLPLPSTLVMEHPTPRAIASYLADAGASSELAQVEALIPAIENLFAKKDTPKSTSRMAMVSDAATLRAPLTEDVRAACECVDRQLELTGWAGRWPGSTHSTAAVSIIRATVGNAVGSVPAVRWTHPDVVKQSTFSSEAMAIVRSGGFVCNAQYFDANAFGISQSEAHVMDPQQRMLLEFGYAALHGASQRRRALLSCDCGVFLGIERPEWMLAQPPSARASSYGATGDSMSVASGRLSFVLGLQGPAYSIDTACSSSLAAMHSAFFACSAHECSFVAPLTVALHLVPHGALSMAFAGMLSVDGRCKTLDTRANGYAFSDGMGASVLQPFFGRAGFRVAQYAGSSVRQDGLSASLTAPNGSAQRMLLQVALSRVPLMASNVASMELHGTGTALGDATEVGAVLAVYGASMRNAPLAVSASKASVGHSEAAAGQIGLLWTLSNLWDRTQAGNAQLRRLNALVDDSLSLESSSLLASVQVGACSTNTAASACNVSSFGYSGTIVHAVLTGRMDCSCEKILGQSNIDELDERVCWPTRLTYCRRAFLWRPASHPFAQRRLLNIGEPSSIMRSSASELLHVIVSDHIVQGRVIFPATAYIEMARTSSAACAGMTNTELSNVFFLQPLAIEVKALLIDCEVTALKFEVRSGVIQQKLDAFSEATVHCAGAVASGYASQCAHFQSTRGSLCHSELVAALYDEEFNTGLQKGPQYRTLENVWAHSRATDGESMGRLQARVSREALLVHPADVDDALCVSDLAGLRDVKGKLPSLPFTVDSAQLWGGSGELWAVMQAGTSTSAKVELLTTHCALLSADGSTLQRGQVDLDARYP